MIRRLVPGGLRTRLALAISLITIAVVGGSFVALHQGTGADLRNRIDQDLHDQYREFERQSLPGVHTSSQLTPAAKRFLASQRYHPEARIFVVEVSNGPVVTNQREVVQHEVERKEQGTKGRGGGGEEVQEVGTSNLLDAPEGLSTISTEEAGSLRVYSHQIRVGGRRIGTFRVADPLNPVTEAQAGLRSTFLIVGALALLASVAIALWVASLVTSPLRRMSRFAQAVDAGDLTQRLEGVNGSDEVSRLAESFNHMLDRLEDAFRRQREFVADASHELRTPLTVLRGEIELLGTGTRGNERDREQAAKLLRELDRMDRLVDDMLTLASAESGTLVERRPVDLDDFFADLRRDLPLFGERDYQVTGTPHGVLEADPDRLAQVFRNLVRNAVAHTGAEGRITVGAQPQDGRIEFSVSDTGPGIAPQHLDRLFDRFYRTDGARARDAGGSGLGLAIARAIVEAHGGRIWAESAPGQGATIRFEIPGYRA